MANYFDRSVTLGAYLGNNSQGAQAKAGLALDSNYVYNTSGDAVAIRFVAPVTSNLVTVYAHMSAHGGTPGNLTCELRDYSAAALPGATLHDSATANPGTTDNKWVTFDLSGSPYECQAGTVYFIVIGDAAGDATNYATIVYGGGPVCDQVRGVFYAVRTTDGFASVRTECYAPFPGVLEFADGTILGMPYEATGVVDGSATTERGLKVAAFTEKLVICGVTFLANANISGMKIYSGTTAPGGVAAATYTFGGGAAALGIARFAPFTCEKATIYRFVFTYGGNATAPGYYMNTDETVADTITAGWGGGTMCHTQDNGAGGWTDSTDKVPRMALIIQDQVAITAGGGGLLSHPGMAGGCNA